LSVVDSGCSAQRVHGVVTRQNESSEIGEELPAIVKEDQEEVEESESPDDVYFGDTCEMSVLLSLSLSRSGGSREKDTYQPASQGY